MHQGSYLSVPFADIAVWPFSGAAGFLPPLAERRDGNAELFRRVLLRHIQILGDVYVFLSIWKWLEVTGRHCVHGRDERA